MAGLVWLDLLEGPQLFLGCSGSLTQQHVGWIVLGWYRTYRIRSRVHVAKYHRSQAQVHHCRSGCDLGHCGAYSTSNRIESLSLSLLRALEFRCSPARVLDVPQGMTLRPLISFCRIRRAAI